MREREPGRELGLEAGPDERPLEMALTKASPMPEAIDADRPCLSSSGCIAVISGLFLAVASLLPPATLPALLLEATGDEARLVPPPAMRNPLGPGVLPLSLFDGLAEGGSPILSSFSIRTSSSQLMGIIPELASRMGTVCKARSLTLIPAMCRLEGTYSSTNPRTSESV